MGYGTDGLTFNVLRAANAQRLPQFRDAKGRRSHSEPDGSDWNPAEWLQAVVGELGELANILKKVRRGDVTREEALPAIRKEFADVVIYFDIFAAQFGIDLGRAIIDKFNEVSVRVGSDIRISEDGSDWRIEPMEVPASEQCDLCPARAEVPVGGGKLCRGCIDTLERA
jgi:NTP pyrophosphatase (non-canonical NTP hydrolase)